MTEINLPRKLTQQLLHLAQSSPEMEICGLIAADSHSLPCCCYPITNCASDPQHRYLMEANQQIAAIKHMRENNFKLFAIYHSHPHSPALPSVTDLLQASYPEAFQLIVSLNTKGVLEIRGFRIVDHQVVEELGLNLVED